MQITEIYKSIQGESTYAGVPCVFVRLTGCNLRCTWCDSEYAFYGGRRMTPQEVFDQVEQLSPTGGLVEVTGGEPMLQERELISLMQRLLDENYTILLETSGERPLERVPHDVIKIVDVKCPNSGEPDTFHVENLETLTSRDEVKFRKYVSTPRAVLMRLESAWIEMKRSALARLAMSTRSSRSP